MIKLDKYFWTALKDAVRAFGMFAVVTLVVPTLMLWILSTQKIVPITEITACIITAIIILIVGSVSSAIDVADYERQRDDNR